MRCRVYWRDEVDGDEELAREPAVLPETCRQEERGQKVRWRTSTGSLMFDIFKAQWWQCLLTGLRNRTTLVVVIKSEILTHFKTTFTVVHIWTWQQSPWLCGWEHRMDGHADFLQTFVVHWGWSRITFLIFWLPLWLRHDWGFAWSVWTSIGLDCHEIWFRHSCSPQDEPRLEERKCLDVDVD